MICTSLQHKNFEQILAILEDPAVEMAEVRLDRCDLTDDQIEELFSESDTPLIATCRIDGCPSPEEAERRLRLAIEAGARFADLEIEAPAQMSKHFQQLCRKHGTEIIRSFHDDIVLTYDREPAMGYFSAVKDGKVGFLDLNGNVTCDFVYAESVVRVYTPFAFVKDLTGETIVLTRRPASSPCASVTISTTTAVHPSSP